MVPEVMPLRAPIFVGKIQCVHWVRSVDLTNEGVFFNLNAIAFIALKVA